MSEWREVKLGNICTFKTGKLNSNAAIENGEFPFYTCAQTIYRTNTYSFDTECVILGGNNAEAKYPIFYKSGKFDAYQRNYVIEPIDSSIINVRWLYYVLSTYLEYMRLASTGATTRFLTLKILKNIKLNVPSLNTQIRIADTLSSYDKLIENNNRRIQILEQTAEALYKEWFVRMRFPGYEKTKFEKGIPEGWEVKKVEEIISFDIGGGWGKNSLEDNYTEPAYVIRGTDIPGMKFSNVNYELLRFHTKSNLKSRRLQDMDIIFEGSGGSSSQRLGRSYFVTDETLAMFDEDVICASFCKLIRIEDRYLAWYFNNYLNYAYKTEILSTFEVQSTGISNFGFSNFKKYHQIIIPPFNLIKKFYDFTFNLYQKQQKLGQQNQNLAKQRDLLLPRLMNGTISVE